MTGYDITPDGVILRDDEFSPEYTPLTDEEIFELRYNKAVSKYLSNSPDMDELTFIGWLACKNNINVKHMEISGSLGEIILSDEKFDKFIRAKCIEDAINEASRNAWASHFVPCLKLLAEKLSEVKSSDI